MAVDAPESNGLPVQCEHEIPDFHFPETDFFRDHFLAGIHNQRVEDRILCIPEFRSVYFDRDALCSETVSC